MIPLGGPAGPTAPRWPGGRRSGRVFYGWIMVAVAFAADFFAVGFFFYSFAVFLKPLTASLGASRGDVSTALALALVASSVFAPLLGRALDRNRIRAVMIGGVLCTAAGYTVASQVTSILGLCLVFGSLIGTGVLAMGGLSAATLVANWFVARRGTALGVATIGISLSGLIMPPIATALIGWIGWRGSYGVYAVVSLLLLVPIALLVVNRPEELGLAPDGGTPPPETARPPAVDRPHRSGDILRNRDFWVLSLSFSLSFFATSAVLSQLVAHATDLGISDYHAALCLSWAAGFAVIAKFSFGYLSDRLDPRLSVALCFGTQLLGVVGIGQSTGPFHLFASSAVFGFGMGGLVPLQGALTGRIFGRFAYGRAAGWMRPVQTPLQAVGPPLAGGIFDATQSYQLAFLICICAYVLAILSAMVLRTR